jgi:hypothetical protein
MAASYPTSQQPQLVQLAPPQWQQPQLVQPVQQYQQQQYTSQYSYIIKQEEEAWQGSLGPQPPTMQPPTMVQVEVRSAPAWHAHDMLVFASVSCSARSTTRAPSELQHEACKHAAPCTQQAQHAFQLMLLVQQATCCSPADAHQACADDPATWRTPTS